MPAPPSTSALPPIDTSIARELCPAHPPPRVAVCVAGGARTLPRPQVYLTIRRNLIEAFGGRVSVFFHLNRGDSPPRVRLPTQPRDYGFAPITVDSAALQAPREALRPLAERINDDDGRQYLASSLAATGGGASSIMNGRGECWNQDPYTRVPNHRMRLLLHYANMRGCYDMVAAAERRRADNALFDWILWTRADVAYYASVPPYCLWNSSFAYFSPGPSYGRKHPISERVTTADEVHESCMIVPRAHAEHVLRDMLTIFARAQPSDEVCRRAPGGFPEAFMRFALAARSGHTFDVGDRLRLGLRPVPVRTAAIAAVIVRQNRSSRAQCANWGALALLVPGLDAWSCAEYMYARGSGRS